ncbi:YoqO family protein [Paenibacillus sp. 102]|uniref:YoqO family protein n=1 Tax=Paenibacillus sp. 102 TaxID=3120823 RepID=UPI0031BA38A8
MFKKVGFWGFIISCGLFVILSQFTNNEWINVFLVLGFIFLLFQYWNEGKEYSRKSIGMIAIVVIVFSFATAFIVIEGQREMEKMTIFQDWLTAAKGLYILIIIVILMRIVMRVGSYILERERK